MMKKRMWFGNAMLLLAAMIWGCAFVAQSVAMDHVGPFTFGSLRFFLGAFALLPVILGSSHWRRRHAIPLPYRRRDLWLGGAVCGGFLFAASSAQQIGLQYTTTAKSGFITALYVVLVPIVGWVLFRRRVSLLLLVSAVTAAVGLYLLCGENGLSLNRGDVYTFVCALLFTGHILTVDYFVTRADGIQLSCIQFLVSGILNGIVALFLEMPLDLSSVAAAWLPLCYTGLLSSGVAYTLQVVGQKHTSPTMASILMSLESVFAALAGLLIGQFLSLREVVGCGVMFAAVIIAQTPWKHKAN